MGEFRPFDIKKLNLHRNVPMFKNLYIYRRYLIGTFWTELRYRYAGTILGFFWVVITPLLEVLIYAVVFSQIINIRSGGERGVSYTLFLTSGLFPFMAFSQVISRGMDAIKSNAMYMRRSLVPSEVFVFKEVLLSGFSFFIYLFLLIPISLIAGNPITWRALLMPVFAIFLLILGFGMSLPLANLRILFPDLGEIIPVILQLWRWTLPIMFTDKNFPAWLRRLMSLNPPYYFIRSFRDVLIEQSVPPVEAWVSMGLWIIFFLIMAHVISGQLRREVKDLL
jgi:lipopolysaccharide transport system permease protein